MRPDAFQEASRGSFFTTMDKGFSQWYTMAFEAIKFF